MTRHDELIEVIAVDDFEIRVVYQVTALQAKQVQFFLHDENPSIAHRKDVETRLHGGHVNAARLLIFH